MPNLAAAAEALTIFSAAKLIKYPTNGARHDPDKHICAIFANEPSYHRNVASFREIIAAAYQGKLNTLNAALTFAIKMKEAAEAHGSSYTNGYFLPFIEAALLPIQGNDCIYDPGISLIGIKEPDQTRIQNLRSMVFGSLTLAAVEVEDSDSLHGMGDFLEMRMPHLRTSAALFHGAAMHRTLSRNPAHKESQHALAGIHPDVKEVLIAMLGELRITGWQAPVRPKDAVEGPQPHLRPQAVFH